MKKRLFTIFVILVIVGIIVEKYLSINISTIFILWGILIFLTILLYFFSGNNIAKLFRDLIIYLNIIFIGSTLFGLDNINTPNYPFEKQKINNVQIYGKVSGINLIQKDKITFTLYSDSISINSYQYAFKAKFLTKIYEKNSRKLNYLYNKISDGNILRLKGVIIKPAGVRNPGEFNYYHYLVEKGYSAILNVFGTKNVKIISDRKDFIGNEIFQIRKTINSRINQLYTRKSAALLRGLLLADRSQIDYKLKEQFINTGVVHVLAVSGLHVGYIVLIFIFLFSRFNIILRYILTIIGLLFFLVITNSPPSVFRAVLMAIIMIISLLSNRDYDSINTISLAALILLIINPSNLFNPGFQLSFSAVIAIIIFVPFFKIKIDESKLSNGTIKNLFLFLSVTISAMVGTLPFTLAYFHKLSIAAIFANLVVIPLIGAILAIGIFSLIISVVSVWIALIYAAANKLLIAVLYFIVSNLGSLKISYIDIHQFSLYDSILFYILIITTIFFWKKFTHLKAKIILTFLLTTIFFIYSNLDKKELLPNGKLSVVAIDIGQGDSFLLKFPKGTTALIDAGNATDNFSSGQRIIIPLLKYLGINKIDYTFISHIDADHYRGIFSLIKNGFIKNLYKPKLDSSLNKDIKFEAFLKSHHIPIVYYKKHVFKIDNSRIYILTDTTFFKNGNFDTNDKSGIIKVVYGNTSILFTGDATKNIEKKYIWVYGKFLKSDILKVGHHGSKTSTSMQFLNYVKPEYALISCGIGNKFHHPNNAIINELKNKKIKIERTDILGAIIMSSDGNNFKVLNWRN